MVWVGVGVGGICGWRRCILVRGREKSEESGGLV